MDEVLLKCEIRCQADTLTAVTLQRGFVHELVNTVFAGELYFRLTR